MVDGRSTPGTAPLRRLAAGILGATLVGALVAPAVMAIEFTPTADLITTTEDHATVTGNVFDNDTGVARSAGLHISSTTPGILTVATDGAYEFTPADGWTGTNQLLGWYLADPDLLDNGNEVITYVRTTVTAVNDAPSFTKGANQSVAANAGAQTVVGWATDISAGPGEGSQTVTFHATTNNDALFSVLPAIAANGDLTYTPAGTSDGTATVTVWLTDNGGTADGGVDTSADQTFTIDINDTEAPVVAVPTVTFGATSSATRIKTTAPLTIHWSATDAGGSGVANYVVEQKLGTGAWTEIYTGTGTSLTRSFAFSTNLQWRVKATDGAGNPSGFTESTVHSLVAYSGSSPVVTSGTWTKVTSSSSVGGSYFYTTTSGRYKYVRFTGIGVLFVAPRTSNGGKATVKIDSSSYLLSTYKSGTTQYGAVIKGKSLASGTHTIRVTNSQGGRRTNFDAFIVLK